jgi:hypothetical protein
MELKPGAGFGSGFLVAIFLLLLFLSALPELQQGEQKRGSGRPER